LLFLCLYAKLEMKGSVMVKISTTTSAPFEIIGYEKTVEYCAKAGFDAWDLSISDFYKYDSKEKKFFETDRAGDKIKLTRRLKQIGEDYGIFCNQTHAPDPTVLGLSHDVVKRSIEITAEAGAKICVVHPACRIGAEENREFFSKLLPFAGDYGVKLAIENMWDWDNEKSRASLCNCTTAESYFEHMEGLDGEYFVACLDIGHAEMMGELANARDLVYALGDRLQALHIHDNDKRLDSHEIPFSMKIDFPPIIKALHDIGYKGEFTLECPCYFRRFNEDNIFEAFQNLANADRKLGNLFDSN